MNLGSSILSSPSVIDTANAHLAIIGSSSLPTFFCFSTGGEPLGLRWSAILNASEAKSTLCRRALPPYKAPKTAPSRTPRSDGGKRRAYAVVWQARKGKSMIKSARLNF